jgi:hypothetical protein
LPVATCSLHSRPALCTSTSEHSYALCCAFAAAGCEALSASGSTWSTQGVVPVTPAHYAAYVSSQSYIRAYQRHFRPHGLSDGHFVGSEFAPTSLHWSIEGVSRGHRAVVPCGADSNSSRDSTQLGHGADGACPVRGSWPCQATMYRGAWLALRPSRSSCSYQAGL